MHEIVSIWIKVNDGLTAWQQAVANVKVPVFEEPQEGILDGPVSLDGPYFHLDPTDEYPG